MDFYVQNPIVRLVMKSYFKNRKELKRKKKTLRRQNESIRQNSKVSPLSKYLHGDPSPTEIHDFNLKDIMKSDFSRKEVRNKFHKKSFVVEHPDSPTGEVLMRYNKQQRMFELGIPFTYLPKRECDNSLLFCRDFTNMKKNIPLSVGLTENDIPNDYNVFTSHLMKIDNNHGQQLLQNVLSFSQCYQVSVGVYFGLKKMGIKKEIKFTQGLVGEKGKNTGIMTGTVHTWIEDSDDIVYDLSGNSDMYGDYRMSSPEESCEKYWGIPNELYYEKRHIIPKTVNSYSMDEVLERRKKEGVLFLDTETIPSGQLNDIVFLDFNGEKFYYPTLEEIESQVLKHNNWESIPQRIDWMVLPSLGQF